MTQGTRPKPTSCMEDSSTKKIDEGFLRVWWSGNTRRWWSQGAASTMKLSDPRRSHEYKSTLYTAGDQILDHLRYFMQPKKTSPISSTTLSTYILNLKKHTIHHESFLHLWFCPLILDGNNTWYPIHLLENHTPVRNITKRYQPYTHAFLFQIELLRLLILAACRVNRTHPPCWDKRQGDDPETARRR